MEVVKYSAKYKAAWDAFVANSKNGTFMLQRDFMDYHADRFTDHSLLFYHKQKLIALLPANEYGSEIHSHGGLSYGGVISDRHMKAAIMLEVFEAMLLYFKALGFTSIRYKAIPHIYHQVPAEEDLYALFRYGAKLYRRDLNSVIYLKECIPYAILRQRVLKKAPPLKLARSFSFDSFMELMKQVLHEKYGLSPAHTSKEIQLLASRFPENIKLYTAGDNTLLAGVIVFETDTTAHCQYIATSAEGRKVGALDVLLDWLIKEVYADKAYFSFGVSTEQAGAYLNVPLIRNKESYGARAVVHDFYELPL